MTHRSMLMHRSMRRQGVSPYNKCEARLTGRLNFEIHFGRGIGIKDSRT